VDGHNLLGRGLVDWVVPTQIDIAQVYRSMTRRRRKPSLPPVGRYDLRDAAMPAGEQLGSPTAVRQRHTRVAAIPDPYEPGKRLLATINIRTDLLELELAHGRISQAAFLVGREIQSKLERQSQVGAGNQWNSGDRVDAYQRHEEYIVTNLEIARDIQAYFSWIGRCLGHAGIDGKILRNVLGDRMSYGACAVLHGKRGDRGARYIAQRFRDALEALANAQAAKGKLLTDR
jgi:Ni/Co efflux regulator RcnB